MKGGNNLEYDLMYKRVFHILKNKIESGLYPPGSSLPSRADLGAEFGTSEKTIRRALSMLEVSGMIETSQRKRAVVRDHQTVLHKTATLSIEKINTNITNDVLKAGVLLCYPLIKNGISLCNVEDLKIPHKILENMEIQNAFQFWKCSKRFWRFFVARNENDLSLRAVDSLGITELMPMCDDIEIRLKYYEHLQEFMRTVERGGVPESVDFGDMSRIYGLAEGQQPAFSIASNSAMALGKGKLESLLEGAEVKYSALYMDILGLIAVGRYKPGDQLPSHRELQTIYGVSSVTTIKAIQILREWGVVSATRGQGIFVEMDLDDLKKVQIPPYLIAYHVRRYFDSLDLMALTIEGAAACAAEHITPEDIRTAQATIDRLWNEEYLYGRTPGVLLNLITKHIGMDAFGLICELLNRNLRIGRSIPALMDIRKTVVNIEIHELGVEALDELAKGNSNGFSRKTAQLFEIIHNLVVKECKRLGYYEAAMEIYDGSALWKW